MVEGRDGKWKSADLSCTGHCKLCKVCSVSKFVGDASVQMIACIPLLPAAQYRSYHRAPVRMEEQWTQVGMRGRGQARTGRAGTGRQGKEEGGRRYASKSVWSMSCVMSYVIVRILYIGISEGTGLDSLVD
jgi:hypothetical protein